MWPNIIEQPIQIDSYLFMLMVGFATAWWLLARELRRRHIDPGVAETTIFLGIIGGVLGAKAAYQLTEAEKAEWGALISGGGLTWHGGLIVAAALVLGYYAYKRLPLLVMMDAVAPMLATGYAFGRIGCQLSGDGDYGIPCRAGDLDSSLCMAYPRGTIPTTQLVHPTPVYEALENFLLFGVLWALRKRIRRPGVLIAIYLVGAGVMRFTIELIRQGQGRPDRFAGLRDAQLVALAQVLLGLGIAAYAYLRNVPEAEAFGVLPAPIEPKRATKKGRK